ncbi:MAG: RNA 2',3'-cyclic phosphodiesterase [Fimbriimonadaceae bacterium]
MVEPLIVSLRLGGPRLLRYTDFVKQGKRIFLAIELSDEARKEILRVQKELGKLSDGVYKPSAKESLHLTLYFCGETEEETIVRIGDALEGMSADAFDVRLGGLKLLPQDDVPRVLGVSVESGGRELKAFQQRIHDICFALAEFKEVRPFVPHVTFARLARDVPAGAKVVKRAIAGLGKIEPVRWRISEVVIFSNEDGKHEVVRRVLLG